MNKRWFVSGVAIAALLAPAVSVQANATAPAAKVVVSHAAPVLVPDVEVFYTATPQGKVISNGGSEQWSQLIGPGGYRLPCFDHRCGSFTKKYQVFTFHMPAYPENTAFVGGTREYTSVSGVKVTYNEWDGSPVPNFTYVVYKGRPVIARLTSLVAWLDRPGYRGPGQ